MYMLIFVDEQTESPIQSRESASNDVEPLAISNEKDIPKGSIKGEKI